MRSCFPSGLLQRARLGVLLRPFVEDCKEQGGPSKGDEDRDAKHEQLRRSKRPTVHGAQRPESYLMETEPAGFQCGNDHLMPTIFNTAIISGDGALGKTFTEAPLAIDKQAAIVNVVNGSGWCDALAACFAMTAATCFPRMSSSTNYSAQPPTSLSSHHEIAALGEARPWAQRACYTEAPDVDRRARNEPE